MTQAIRWLFHASLAWASVVADTGGTAPPPDLGSLKPTTRLVLAYHYPWYGYKAPTRWDAQPSLADHPLLGAYRSDDPTLIDFQLSLAQEAGLDGFIVSWGGPGSMQDKVLGQMLEQVEGAPDRSFRLCLICEAYAGRSDFNPDKLKNELGYVIQGPGRRPAYLRVDGKPVLFIYTPQSWPPGDWRAVFETLARDFGRAFFVAVADNWDIDLAYLSAFDAIGPYADKYYTDDELLTCQRRVAERLSDRGGPLIASIIGGGSRIRKLGFDFERAGGAYIRQRLALAQRARANWLTITSWNEWFEGMQIEPSREYGFEQIKHIREMAHQFKGRPLQTSSAGARLAVETSVLPDHEQRSAPVGVRVRVRNPSPCAIYAVKCTAWGKELVPPVYVLHPGQEKQFRLPAPDSPPSSSPWSVRAQGFLSNGQVVTVESTASPCPAR
jgi:hypothetical protein